MSDKCDVCKKRLSGDEEKCPRCGAVLLDSGE